MHRVSACRQLPAEVIMRLLLVHPSCLMYSKIFLRLEPLGLERVAGAALAAGHDVRMVDLQVFSRGDLAAELASFQPEALGTSLHYLANVPEAIEISAQAKQAVPRCFVFLGGHSVSFIADDVLQQARGSVDAVLRGEGETAIGPLLDAIRDGGLDAVPGAVTTAGRGPAPVTMAGIDSPRPARELTRRRLVTELT
jgi:hopanoid C-3 methylase